MASWDEFAAAAPELADRCEPRFKEPGVVMVGTLTRDGSPRISPIEITVLGGHLWLGMMPGSTKALDLQRDPRCLVHSIVTSKDGNEGDVKVRGRTVEIVDADQRSAFADAVEKTIGWRPTDPYHLFRVEVESVAHAIVEGDGMAVRFWAPDKGETKTFRAN